MKISRHFITGFVAVVPVVLTVYVLFTLFHFLDNILGRFVNVYLERTVGFYIPGIGIVLFFIAIFLIGFLANRFIGQKIFPRIERWFVSLPLISKIYPTLKQIVRFILAQKEFGFKKVVLVEYPSKGIWSLGFMTNESFPRVQAVTGKEMASVFMPSAPGPLTGYVIFIPKEELRFVDIPVAEAIKIIISGGVFKP